MNLEYFVQLIIRISHSRERGHTGDHFDEYTSDAPHIQGCRIVRRPEQDVGWSIPQRYYFMRVRVTWHRFSTSQS